MESIGIISGFMKSIPKDNAPTADEQEIMIEAFMETMPEKERAKWKNVIGMMKAR